MQISSCSPLQEKSRILGSKRTASWTASGPEPVIRGSSPPEAAECVEALDTEPLTPGGYSGSRDAYIFI
ncbi:MAG: hypothetical protein K1W28_01875 [Lachnospiraceae bacterium]